MLKFLMLSLSFFICTVCVKAQVKTPQQRLDSILTVYHNRIREDSLKLVVSKQVYIQYMRMKNFDKANVYIQKTINLARKLNLLTYEGNAYERLGLYHHGLGNYVNAEGYYLQGAEVYKSINEEDNYAGMFFNLGALYTAIPDYAKALEANQKAVAIYLKINNQGDLAGCYSNIATIYQKLNQDVNAYPYLQKALTIFLKYGETDNRGVASVCETIGEIILVLNETDLKKIGINSETQRYFVANGYFSRALKALNQKNDLDLAASVIGSIGEVYERTGNKKLAIDNYQQSLAVSEQSANPAHKASALLKLGNFYQNERDYTKASIYYKEAVKITNDDKNLGLQKDALLKLSDNDEALGNYTNSLANYKQYIAIRDQIFDKEKQREITTRRLQLDFSVKESEYQLRQKITYVELQKQLLLAKQQQQQLVLRQQQLEISDKQKSLQRLIFLKKQADLENEKRHQANVLKQEKYRSNIEKHLKDKEINLQRSELNFNKKISWFLAILVVMLFASAAFVSYSQRKTARLNKLVLAQKQELEKLGRVKDRIFSVVSHDMRTPVNSLISFIQLLEGGAISQEKLVKYAANLKSTLGYTSAMMENLLNWASSQMQGYQITKEHLELKSTAQEVADSLFAVAAQKNIRITNDIPASTVAFADANMTSLILRNLMSNAIKFTPNAGQITLTSIVINDKIVVTVSDTGIGLSAEQLESINAESNYDIGKSTSGTNKEKGTGIGLLLCKSFANLMDGYLKAKTNAQVGSNFSLYLPLFSTT